MDLCYHAPETHEVRSTIVGRYLDGVLLIAMSRCSSKNQFSKKIGRRIAQGRINADKTKRVVYTDNPLHDFFSNAKELVEDAQTDKSVVQEQEEEQIESDRHPLYGAYSEEEQEEVDALMET